MSRKETNRARAESDILRQLKRRGGSGATARELALEMGWPWQQAAWALRRLVARMDALVVISERKDECYRVCKVVMYRAPTGPSLGLFPAWMMGGGAPVKKTLHKPSRVGGVK